MSGAVTGEPIAVLDAGVRVKGASTVEQLWALLRDGADLIGLPPAGRAGRPGAFLDDVAGFDADYFGLSPAEAARMDPQHRLLLEVSSEALMRAGKTRAGLEGTRAGVFLGLLASDYLHLQLRGDGADPEDRYWLTGNDPAFAAGRLAYLLGVHGPALTVNTACSSSLLAVHLACQALRLGECDLALAGGASLILAPDIDAFMTRVGALSPTGACRPFAADADGMVRSEGAVVLALKRLSDARADRDDVLAVLRGSVVNHDGRSAGLTVPNGHAQRRLYTDALAVAGVPAGDIGFLEAHGTGTPLGDPIELESLDAVYGTPGGDGPWVGSLKANLGHLDAAAGVAGLLKAALVVRDGRVPGQLHAAEPTALARRPAFGLRIPQRLESWPQRTGPRTAAVSAFGLSGTNVHVILEQAQPAAPERAPDGPGAAGGAVLLVLSHRTSEGLAQMTAAQAELLRSGGRELASVAAAAARCRDHHDERLAVVAADTEQAVTTLSAGLRSSEARTGRVDGGRSTAPVLVFAGQGNEWAGMLNDPGDDGPAGAAFADALNRCRRAAADLGHDRLAALLADPAQEDATDPALAPGATFSLQVAQVARWAALGVRPGAVLGHSLGEVAAAHAAGVLDLSDAMRVVLARTEVIDSAGPTGQMLAVGLGPAEAAKRVAGTGVEVACLNDDRSCTLAGPAEEVQALADRLTDAGVFARLLGGRHAFHSRAMSGFAGPLREVLAGLRHRPPAVTRYTSVPGSSHEDPAEEWVAGMVRPVQFSAAMRRALAEGWTTFVEVGPAPALRRAMLGAAASAQVTATVTSSLCRGVPARTQLLNAAADLYLAGAEVSLDTLLPGPTASASVPTYAWDRQHLWHTPQPAQLGYGVPAPPPPSGKAAPSEPVSLDGTARTAEEAAERARASVAVEVRSAVRQVLALHSDHELDGRTRLVDLGVDSVAAADLTGQLQRRLRMDIEADLTLRAPDLDALIDTLTPAEH